MNVTNHGIQEGLISDITLGYIGVVFKLVLNPVLGVMGIYANIVNVAVFYKTGLADGVTQNFFILSISDGLVAVTCLVNSVSYILQTRVFVGSEDRQLHAYVVYWMSIVVVMFPQNISLVTTVMLAVVRCCCVAMPLRVKFLITSRRQLIAILLFSVGTTLVLLSTFAPMTITYVQNYHTNTTYIHFAGFDWPTYTVFASISFNVSFIIVILCLIILSHSLSKSSKFRESSAKGTSCSDSIEQSKDKRRDIRIVQTVLLVSVVFIGCYLPHIILSVVKTLEKDFSSNGRYRNANKLFLMANEMFLLLNVNINIYIYVYCNVRYRAVFRSMFGLRSQKIT
ncbi:chemosensory receptor B [Elysia marginata]|uniref:Chemosensory receptor B n=1 Tax=Elysia marginata TaxID=1093978 RepID=A0AAV4ED76_9GAST|nr:chemosensory receptor B [Elysia marginata]